MRAVVDTNVWISALLNPRGAPAQLLAALRSRLFTLIISQPLLDELVEVLSRPRIRHKYRLTEQDIEDLLATLRAGEMVEVTGTSRIVRDPDDDMVVETALVGRADALVSRDDDLKGDTQLVQVLAALDITVHSVQHFLDALGMRNT